MNRRGLTMLETLFAFWMVCFILLIVANLFPSSMLAIRRGENEVVAANLAQNILEQRRSAPFAEMANDPPAAVYGPDGTCFTPTLQVLDVPGSAPTRLKRLRVTVTWGAHSLGQELMVCNLAER